MANPTAANTTIGSNVPKNRHIDKLTMKIINKTI
jgi:hypothetical protein